MLATISYARHHLSGRFESLSVAATALEPELDWRLGHSIARLKTGSVQILRSNWTGREDYAHVVSSNVSNDAIMNHNHAYRYPHASFYKKHEEKHVENMQESTCLQLSACSFYKKLY